jgi:hypothetical protein
MSACLHHQASAPSRGFLLPLPHFLTNIYFHQNWSTVWQIRLFGRSQKWLSARSALSLKSTSDCVGRPMFTSMAEPPERPFRHGRIVTEFTSSGYPDPAYWTEPGMFAGLFYARAAPATSWAYRPVTPHSALSAPSVLRQLRGVTMALIHASPYVARCNA